ncbi:MAG: CapA family protein, partial [Candidatus Vogelbacteria bacterium]|nr:CapA family protein [Candidatus Vogelbacteria bacterium]
MINGRIFLKIVFCLFLVAFLAVSFFVFGPSKNIKTDWSTTVGQYAYKSNKAIVIESVTPDLAVIQTPEVSLVAFSTTSLPAIGRALLGDIGKMKLYLYENGQIVDTFKMVSVGKVGVPWETPRGQFKILAKEENHFSTIGEVWMPFSMQFLGNYFIHGWPYYNDGTPVSLGYSGGCIRLETIDAEKVYNFSAKGIPLVIIGNNLATTEAKSRYLIKNQNLDLSAQSYLVADLDAGEIIAQKNSTTTWPMASITKLMTALVALDQVNPLSDVVISDQAVATFGDSGGLQAGEILTAKDLIFPLLLESSNDAGEALALFAGRANFIKEMNKRAQSIGLTSTIFTDPSGIDAGNTSTVNDLFLLARHIYFEKKFIFDITTKKEYSCCGHTWRNFNPFSAESGFLGGKSGQTTAADQTFVNVFSLVGDSGEKRKIAIILLKSLDRDGDTKKVLSYLKNDVSFVAENQKTSSEAVFTTLMPLPLTASMATAVNLSKSTPTISLLAVGDMMLARGVLQSAGIHNEGDLSYIFENIKDLKDGSDILMGNLEGPASEIGEDKGNLYSFEMDPAVLKTMKDIGFDILNVANNHAGDWGLVALADSLRQIKKAGLFYTGGGLNYASATTPVIIEKNGLKIGFLGFSDVGPASLVAKEKQAGILLATDPNFSEIINRASHVVDILVVNFHFGNEYENFHNARQEKLAHGAIDAGAKIVIGHHPHVVQDTEKYNGGYIAYSLGNFIFD